MRTLLLAAALTLSITAASAHWQMDPDTHEFVHIPGTVTEALTPAPPPAPIDPVVTTVTGVTKLSPEGDCSVYEQQLNQLRCSALRSTRVAFSVENTGTRAYVKLVCLSDLGGTTVDPDPFLRPGEIRHYTWTVPHVYVDTVTFRCRVLVAR